MPSVGNTTINYTAEKIVKTNIDNLNSRLSV